MDKLENENEIMERIKKECKCGYCHGSVSDGVGLGCTCTDECDMLGGLQIFTKCAKSKAEERRRDLFSLHSIEYASQEYFRCAELAHQIGLARKVNEYLKNGIYVYEEFGDLDSAKKYSKKFGFTDLAEYYQKLIDLKAARPE